MEELIIEDGRYGDFGSINPILSMPNFKELNLRYASFMMDADSLSPNENLRVLDLNKAKVSKYNSDPWADREDLGVEEIQKALTVEDLKLDSVEFAKEMEHLKLLNFTLYHIKFLHLTKLLYALKIKITKK